MTAYPVHYRIARPKELAPLQLLVRVVAFCALGMLGLSFGSVFAFAYLALPVIAAVRLSGREARSYVERDGAYVRTALRWFAAVSAWAGLVSDRIPASTPDETLTIEIEPGAAGSPTPGSALVRVLWGIPSAVALWVLGMIGVLVWLWAALSILVKRRIGDDTFEYLAGLQRWSIRLLAYQASLVEAYPPFALAEAPPVELAARSQG